MYKAKTDFLWYNKGEEIKKEDIINCKSWSKELLVEEVFSKKPTIKNKK